MNSKHIFVNSHHIAVNFEHTDFKSDHILVKSDPIVVKSNHIAVKSVVNAKRDIVPSVQISVAFSNVNLEEEILIVFNEFYFLFYLILIWPKTRLCWD